VTLNPIKHSREKKPAQYIEVEWCEQGIIGDQTVPMCGDQTMFIYGDQIMSIYGDQTMSMYGEMLVNDRTICVASCIVWLCQKLVACSTRHGGLTQNKHKTKTNIPLILTPKAHILWTYAWPTLRCTACNTCASGVHVQQLNE
jgi:hypothetical protein